MLSVTTTPEGGKIEEIHIETLLYMTWERTIDRSTIYSREGIFYLPGPVKYWLNAINNMGYKFLHVDRATIINTENVVSVNEIYKEAFFDKEVSKKSIRCEIVNHRYKAFIEELTIMNPRVILT
ncbi:hypothetical protein [Paenibacillus xylanilyticus]|uniref:HTH LytTR-type domain-containing protein n=1 Tax=Paenibacillus xylanilyticus TaxID=248903 RepID=A0A7Y6BTR7_9BACL|nr:hypothetical protein [Paenibacillus xylanilyticus]NUU74790.1 hypothetical protein [Paenibacillus xylanilyticus]